MGILDEAIREHLELKRQHGAGDSELQKLEDEAFGPPERPGFEEPPADEAAEAPTEFLAAPAEVSAEATERPASFDVDVEAPIEADVEAPAVEEERGRRTGEPSGRPEPATQIADLQEGPDATEQPPPAVEETAHEHEAVEIDAVEHEPLADEAVEAEPVDEGSVDAGAEAGDGRHRSHSTEERQAIAEQPTELHDLEPAPEGTEPDSAPKAATEEAAAEEAAAEPHPPAEAAERDSAAEGATAAEHEKAEGGTEEEDDEFFDHQRLSDELDRALEAPFDHEQEDDVLGETPDFLEEAPEDDQLWFEQRPPKDFDFGD